MLQSMYLTRIAGIEPSTTRTRIVIGWMYLTRIAGIEPEHTNNSANANLDVSYPHSGN